MLLGRSALAAEQRYYGNHPAKEGGFCYVDGSHTHPYAPDPKIANLYRTQGGHLYFVGDPYFFGYTRPAVGYDAHHPIHPVFGGGWCYLDGPHYHFFHPHQEHVPGYIVFGGRYYYIGHVDPSYLADRPRLYIEPPVDMSGYATAFSQRNQLALAYGHPASVGYVVAGKLPKRHYVPAMYSGAYFGLPGFHAGMSVGVPGVSAHVGVSLPAVGVAVGAAAPGVVVAPPPGVVVVGPGHVPPGWYRGKKKGWKKWKRGWKRGW
jgi:hypothetical protein